MMISIDEKTLQKIKENVEKIVNIVNNELCMLKYTISFNIVKKEDNELLDFDTVIRILVEESTAKLSQKTIEAIRNVIDCKDNESNVRYSITVTNDSYSTYAKEIQSNNYNSYIEEKDKEVFRIYYYNVKTNICIDAKTGLIASFYAKVDEKKFNDEDKTKYFNIVNGLYDIFGKNLNKDLCFVQSLNLKFYVLNWNHNADKPEMQNILRQCYIEEAIANIYKNKVFDKEAIRTELESAFMHEFWGRYQYEIGLSAKFDDEVKSSTDIYEQLKPNLDLIVDYVYSKLYNGFHIKKKENGETICQYIKGNI